MLAVETPYPNAGSRGFLKPDAAPIRILQRNRDNTVLIAIEEQYRTASSNRTVALTDLAETKEAASTPAVSAEVEAIARKLSTAQRRLLREARALPLESVGARLGYYGFRADQRRNQLATCNALAKLGLVDRSADPDRTGAEAWITGRGVIGRFRPTALGVAVRSHLLSQANGSAR